ncbi:MAG: hypothetical protein V3U45_03705 [bacterium]
MKRPKFEFTRLDIRWIPEDERDGDRLEWDFTFDGRVSAEVATHELLGMLEAVFLGKEYPKWFASLITGGVVMTGTLPPEEAER